MTRERLVVGNWKMHTTLGEAQSLAEALGEESRYIEFSTHTVVCPPMPWLLGVQEALGSAPVKLGVQDAFPGDFAARTGSVSMGMIAPHVEYVIIGHSERRMSGQDTHESINAKVKSAFEHGLTPILCVGEFVHLYGKKRRRGRPTEIEAASNIYMQLKRALDGVAAKYISKLVVAYEPVWAIGTGNAATPEYANVMIAGLREALAYHASARAAEQARILYGGSVTGSNAQDYAVFEALDGALVGGASLKAKEFLTIAAKFSEERQ